MNNQYYFNGSDNSSNNNYYDNQNGNYLNNNYYNDKVKFELFILFHYKFIIIINNFALNNIYL